METAQPAPAAASVRRRKPLAFARCCGRYLRDFENTPAPDARIAHALALQRFRAGDADYLLATWHPRSTRPNVEFEPGGHKWLGLEVRGHRAIDA